MREDSSRTFARGGENKEERGGGSAPAPLLKTSLPLPEAIASLR
jgi:hypothetical protein